MVDDECLLVDPMYMVVHYTAQLALQDNHALFILFISVRFSLNFNFLLDVYPYVISFEQHSYKSSMFKIRF